MQVGLRDEPLLVFDGACGTNLQELAIPASAWDGPTRGATSCLNLSAPEAIEGLHAVVARRGRAWWSRPTPSARARSCWPSTASSATACERINRRRASENAAPGHRRAAAALRGGLASGLTTKLPSLGHIGFDELHAAYRGAGAARCVEAGVDALHRRDLARTSCRSRPRCSRRSTTSTALRPGRPGAGVGHGRAHAARCWPGADLAAAVAATLEPFPLFSLGLELRHRPREHGRRTSRCSGAAWPRRLSVIPNAGLPGAGRRQDRATRSTPGDVRRARCGATSPRTACRSSAAAAAPRPTTSGARRRRWRGLAPRGRGRTRERPALASAYHAVGAAPGPGPLLDRRARQRQRLEALPRAPAGRRPATGAVEMAQRAGTRRARTPLDLCVAYAGRDELADMTRADAAVRDVAAASRWCIDSTDAARCSRRRCSLHRGQRVRQLGQPRGRRRERSTASAAGREAFGAARGRR
ncbi:MAG: hypothetical protein M0C28_11220 [Candidatus Moduliflexus flocculans]|nr:hypothetical protein [Candidatus Moduliflexus flocculans]